MWHIEKKDIDSYPQEVDPLLPDFLQCLCRVLGISQTTPMDVPILTGTSSAHEDHKNAATPQRIVSATNQVRFLSVFYCCKLGTGPS